MLSMYIYSILLVIILALVKYHWSRRKLYALVSNMPGPRGWPVIGNALLFYCKTEDTLCKISALFDMIGKEPGRFWLGPYLMIGLRNPVHLEKIMCSSKFAYKHELMNILGIFMGEGLVTASGMKPKYKIHRRILQPMFDLKFVTSMVSIISKQTDICMQELEKYVDKGTFNINDPIGCCVMDIVGEGILGKKMESQQKGLSDFGRYMVEMVEVAFIRMTKVWLQFDFIFNRSKLKEKSDVMIATNQEFIEKALIDSSKRRKLVKEEEDTKFVPTIDRLSEFIENNPDVINHKDLIDHLVTLMSAASDTISLVLSSAALCFGMYPEYQEKAAEEIRSIIGEQPKEITLEDLYKMEYLDMCIKDAVRLFPVGSYLLKKVLEDFTLDKWILPKGAAIVVPLFNLHRDPDYWDNPTHFHPDHFLPEAVKKRHVYAYIPFSAGPRGCIGKTLANIVLKMFMVNLLQRFEIHADGKAPDVEVYADISTRPKKGYNCRLRKREWKTK